MAGSTTQATFAYDPADRRSTMTYGNSAVTTWTLDKNSQVTELAVTLGGGTLQAWDYGYSNAGDPLSQTDVSFGTMGEAYQYDGLHRLTAYQQGQITGSNSIAYPGSSQAWQLTTGGRLVAVDGDRRYARHDRHPHAQQHPRPDQPHGPRGIDAALRQRLQPDRRRQPVQVRLRRQRSIAAGPQSRHAGAGGVVCV